MTQKTLLLALLQIHAAQTVKVIYSMALAMGTGVSVTTTTILCCVVLFVIYFVEFCYCLAICLFFGLGEVVNNCHACLIFFVARWGLLISQPLMLEFFVFSQLSITPTIIWLSSYYACTGLHFCRHWSTSLSLATCAWQVFSLFFFVAMDAVLERQFSFDRKNA